jgi:hypothetical protein
MQPVLLSRRARPDDNRGTLYWKTGRHTNGRARHTRDLVRPDGPYPVDVWPPCREAAPTPSRHRRGWAPCTPVNACLRKGLAGGLRVAACPLPDSRVAAAATGASTVGPPALTTSSVLVVIVTAVVGIDPGNWGQPNADVITEIEVTKLHLS